MTWLLPVLLPAGFLVHCLNAASAAFVACAIAVSPAVTMTLSTRSGLPARVSVMRYCPGGVASLTIGLDPRGVPLRFTLSQNGLQMTVR